MMVLRQYSTDYRVLCSSSKQAACVTQLPPGKQKTNLTEQKSHWSIFVILDEHMQVCVCVMRCDNETTDKSMLQFICTSWWSGLRSTEVTERMNHDDDIITARRAEQQMSTSSKTKNVCLQPLFSLSKSVLRVESVTTQYTDLCFSGNRLSLCQSTEDWREGWGSELPFGVEC